MYGNRKGVLEKLLLSMRRIPMRGSRLGGRLSLKLPIYPVGIQGIGTNLRLLRTLSVMFLIDCLSYPQVMQGT
ncbi:unnamed protein product, partial [Vitis vinifera]